MTNIHSIRIGQTVVDSTANGVLSNIGDHVDLAIPFGASAAVWTLTNSASDDGTQTQSWAGTVAFKFTLDGVSWHNCSGQMNVDDGDAYQYATFNGAFSGPCASRLTLRAILTEWTSGSVYVVIRAGAGINGVHLSSPLPGGTNSIGQVTGAFYPAIQPVSGTVAVNNFPASQAVTGAFYPATQPVSGTFFQATQPVSGTIAVSNFPVTQPVSGSVSVSNFPSSQAVTGTFWQTTQPVSGTFWQATQPVSGTLTVNTVDVSALAKDTTLVSTNTALGTVNTNLGTDGATPPTIPGTGVRGWLRSIYDKLASIYTSVSGTLTVSFSAPQHVIVDSGLLTAPMPYLMAQSAAGRLYSWTSGSLGITLLGNGRVYINNPGTASKTLTITEIVIDNPVASIATATIYSGPTVVPTTAIGQGVNALIGSAASGSLTTGATLYADVNATALSGGSAVTSMQVASGVRTVFNDTILTVAPGQKVGVNVTYVASLGALITANVQVTFIGTYA